VARRRWIDRTRHDLIHKREEDHLRLLLEEAQLASSTRADFPDERLNLLFVCAHPAIDPAVRTPLMLQAVLGLDANRIAGAFLTSPTAMSQRLVRAKTRIRDARIPFRLPAESDFSERCTEVLEAVYVAYTAGWNGSSDGGNPDLASEAIFLARLLVEHLPDEPEARGLLSLLLHSEARKSARFSEKGAFVPLIEQDPQLWDVTLIEEAEEHLWSASRMARPGRYQWEAAIQSVHAARRLSGKVQWPVIVSLYDQVLAHSGGEGAAIGRAAALAENGNFLAALEALDRLPPERVKNHQPYWATRGHVLDLCGRRKEAAAAWRRALGFTEMPALRMYLSGRAEFSESACRSVVSPVEYPKASLEPSSGPQLSKA